MILKRTDVQAATARKVLMTHAYAGFGNCACEWQGKSHDPHTFYEQWLDHVLPLLATRARLDFGLMRFLTVNPQARNLGKVLCAVSQHERKGAADISLIDMALHKHKNKA
jgi:hypothetical protein